MYKVGFDLVPPLTRSGPDQYIWVYFIQSILERSYLQPDHGICAERSYVSFYRRWGKWALLPKVGHEFRRFSCDLDEASPKYHEDLEHVWKIMRQACSFFHRNFHCWNEKDNTHGHYSWEQVDRSVASCSNVRITRTRSLLPGR